MNLLQRIALKQSNRVHRSYYKLVQIIIILAMLRLLNSIVDAFVYTLQIFNHFHYSGSLAVVFRSEHILYYFHEGEHYFVSL
jgi:hypothetical protein